MIDTPQDAQLFEQKAKIEQIEKQLVSMQESYNNLLIRYQAVNKWPRTTGLYTYCVRVMMWYILLWLY